MDYYPSNMYRPSRGGWFSWRMISLSIMCGLLLATLIFVSLYNRKKRDARESENQPVCFEDRDCGLGRLCMAGNCIEGNCRKDSDCALGYKCLNLRCGSV